MTDDVSVIEWLLDPQQSDPSIRWQVLRDVLGAPDSEWSAERAKVETEGWGARLLALEDEDGRWSGGAHFPADFDWRGPEAARGPDGRMATQPWTATSHSLSLLREFGLDPASERAQRMVALLTANARWEGGQPYWEGETEPCINGTVVANGSYFGVGMAPVVERLVKERLDDGGWNCEAENGSVRTSFGTTINVLEGLLEYERATGGGTSESREARRTGEEYLLDRALFRRLSTGEPADERFLLFAHPNRWRYDVLRGLDHFRAAGVLTGVAPDPRLDEAIEHLRSRRLEDGTWPLDWSPPGRVWFDVDDGPGEPSRWVTLRALRVVRWWDSRTDPNG